MANILSKLHEGKASKPISEAESFAGRVMKTKAIVSRMEVIEHRELMEFSRIYGKTASRLLIETTLTVLKSQSNKLILTVEQRDEILDLIFQLSCLGKNLNQIACNLNVAKLVGQNFGINTDEIKKIGLEIDSEMRRLKKLCR